MLSFLVLTKKLLAVTTATNVYILFRLFNKSMDIGSMQVRKKNGKDYAYLVKPIKLGNKTKILQRYLGRAPVDKEKIKKFEKKFKIDFELREIQARARYAIANLASKCFSEDDFFGLEILKSSYDKFISSLYPDELDAYEEQFEVDYVYNTTSMEGNTLTLQETKLVLIDKVSPSQKELREVYEVRNYEKVREFMKSYKGDLSERLMTKLHSLIEKDVDEHTLGSFRKMDLCVSSTEWLPSPHPMIKQDVAGLIEWYGQNKEAMHPVELAARFHHRFEQIHPFTEGNGRVGRELFNFILKKFSFPPLIFKVEKRGEYLASLEEADKGELKRLVQFAKDSLIEQRAREKIVKESSEKRRSKN